MNVHVMKLVQIDGEEDDVEMEVSSVELDDSGLWIYVKNTQHWSEIRTYDGRRAYIDKEEYEEHLKELADDPTE